MNTLNTARRAANIRALVEGNSIRATTRLTGASKGTVLRLLAEFGEFCAIYQDHALVNLPVRAAEIDEVWGFCGAKAKNATKDGQGDLWTYTAICADSKLMFSWLVGAKTMANTKAFVLDVASRMAARIQLTSDGMAWYPTAVENAFKWNGCDFAQIIKTFGLPLDENERARRYSPMVCTGVVRTPVMGHPDMDKVSTSYVERANLSIRMGIRRMTRLTNAFSKKAENHAHAFAIHMMHYNFCRSHMTLTKAAKGIKTTPAMASGLTDHVWTVEEVLGMMDPDRLLQ